MLYIYTYIFKIYATRRNWWKKQFPRRKSISRKKFTLSSKTIFSMNQDLRLRQKNVAKLTKIWMNQLKYLFGLTKSYSKQIIWLIELNVGYIRQILFQFYSIYFRMIQVSSVNFKTFRDTLHTWEYFKILQDISKYIRIFNILQNKSIYFNIL